jgi:hypothetical protein
VQNKHLEWGVNAHTMLMMGTKVRMKIHPEEEIPKYQPAKAKEDKTFWEA